MAEIHDQLVLDIDQALREIRRLTDALDDALRGAKLDIDLGPFRTDLDRAEQSIEGLADEMRRVDSAAGGAADSASRLDTEFRQAESEAADLTRNVRQAEAETKDLDRAADRASTSFGAMGKASSTLRTALAGIGVGLVGAKLLGFARDSVDAFSDLQESTSKVGVVFGQFAGQIETFAQTAPQALGLSTAAATEMAGTFGNLLLTVGLSQEAASGMSQEIVQLGADLASFNNIEVTEALDKLRAGLAGEAEPLRALGVFLSESAVSAKAMELGLADANGEVSQAAKVQARYALIMEQTVTAQGDFARTADGIANSSRTLSGLFENLKATLGEQLAPAFKAILDQMPALIDRLERLGPAFAAAATAAADAAPAVLGFFGAVATGFASVQQGDLNANLTLAISNMIKQLEEGVDPATAMANAMAFLARRRPGLGIFTDEVETLRKVSGATAAEVKLASQSVQGLGANFGVGTRDVAALSFEIDKVNEELRTNQFAAAAAQGQQYLAFLNQAGQEQAALNDVLASSDGAMQILMDASDEAGISLEELATNAGAFGPEVQQALEVIDPEKLKLGDMSRHVANLARQLGESTPEIANLVDSLGGAVDDIGLSAEEMTQNMIDSIEQLANFDANILILSTQFPKLAAKIREAGPGASAAAQEYVDNIDLAGKAETALENDTSVLSQSVIDTVTTALQNADIDAITSEEFAGIAAGITDPAVLAAIETALAALGIEIEEGLSGVDLTQAGIDAGLGFATGLTDPRVIAAINASGKRMAFTAAAATNRFLEARSPSKLFMEIGENAGLGFVIGLEESIKPAFDLPRGIPAALRLPAAPAFSPPAIDQSRVQQITVETNIHNPSITDLETERTRLAQTSAQVAGLLAGTII